MLIGLDGFLCRSTLANVVMFLVVSFLAFLFNPLRIPNTSSGVLLKTNWKKKEKKMTKYRCAIMQIEQPAKFSCLLINPCINATFLASNQGLLWSLNCSFRTFTKERNCYRQLFCCIVHYDKAIKQSYDVLNKLSIAKLSTSEQFFFLKENKFCSQELKRQFFWR